MSNKNCDVLKNLQKEVDKLELSMSRKNNYKIKYISSVLIKFLLPYITAVMGMVTLGSFISKGLPFGSVTTEKYLYTKTLKDSYGGYSSDEMYSIYNNEEYKNRVIYYSNWTIKDGEYRRIVETYDIKPKNIKYSEKILEMNNMSIRELCGKPSSVEVQRKSVNNFSERLDEKIEVIIYDEDKNTYITEEFDKSNSTAFWFVCVLIPIAFAGAITNTGDLKLFKKLISEIENASAMEAIYLSELAEKLNTKKANILYLQRGVKNEK